MAVQDFVEARPWDDALAISPGQPFLRKRYEHTPVCTGCSGGYVARANRLGIQNWRMASTTAGMSRHDS